jgi:NADH dehydrogenase
LDDPSSYGPALAGSDTVVHLAALTGKGAPKEHFRVNAEGTELLLERCRREGVARFLHVSTIAVTFPEKRHYPYARSKEESERLVRESGLDWAILRPTIVLGPNSPLWTKFFSLASAPILPVFGSGQNRVNPVHVNDVVSCILSLLASDRLGGRTVECGGRDVLTMGEFLRAMRRAARGREGPALHLPVGVIVEMLSLVGRFALPILPVSAGQFYAFRYDGVAEITEGLAPEPSDRMGVEEMIREMLPHA